ncbi:hypothetical protein MBANPS3_010775 [Mucor bainieri]
MTTKSILITTRQKKRISSMTTLRLHFRFIEFTEEPEEDEDDEDEDDEDEDDEDNEDEDKKGDRLARLAALAFTPSMESFNGLVKSDKLSKK